jgi:hypothetical protein
MGENMHAQTERGFFIAKARDAEEKRLCATTGTERRRWDELVQEYLRLSKLAAEPKKRPL